MEESKDRPIIYFEHADILNSSGKLVISDMTMSIGKGEFVPVFEPFYMRKPQAERNAK